jgi:hypothetical protein
MNFEGLGGSFCTYLLVSAAFPSGPKKEHRAGPTGLAYGGAIYAYPRFYPFLMYIELRTSDTVHKQPCCIGSGLCELPRTPPYR